MTDYHFEWQGLSRYQPSDLTRVSIFLQSDYQWGSGWTQSQSEHFHDVVYTALRQEFCVEPRKDDYDCEHLYLKNARGYRNYSDLTDLYLHPMEFSGYATKETVSAIVKILTPLAPTVFVKDVRIDRAPHYELNDQQYAALLAENICGIRDFIQALPKSLDPGEEFAQTCRLHRVGDHAGLSSLDVDWQFVNNAAIMLDKLEEDRSKEIDVELDR